MDNLYKFYSDGHYDEGIAAIRTIQNQHGQTTPALDELLIQCYIRGNYTDKAVFHAISLYRRLAGRSINEEMTASYYRILQNEHIVQAGLQVLHDLNMLKDTEPLPAEMRVLDAVEEIIAAYRRDNSPLILYPMIWPVAFGDVLVLHQFIKQKKLQEPHARIVLIMPFNRRDLRELAELNTAIDYRIDVTLLAEESDRLRSLLLPHGDVLNVARQERMILGVLERLQAAGVPFDIEKTRYFPLLAWHPYRAGWRCWEKRAELFLAGHELPKLCEQRFSKKKKITVHFREARYEDPARSVGVDQAQQIIDRLRQYYPEYEIVRLGDPSMTRLQGCRNASHEDLSLAEQVREIQESVLFIGTPSAPQHLAVACSDTPVICLDYVLAPSCSDPARDAIAKLSYEPVGRQVKAVLYLRMYDGQGREVLPYQHQEGVRVERVRPEELLAHVRRVLG